jgi:hypothetical protein
VIANNKCRARRGGGRVEREVWSKKGRGVLREGLEGVSVERSVSEEFRGMMKEKREVEGRA